MFTMVCWRAYMNFSECAQAQKFAWILPWVLHRGELTGKCEGAFLKCISESRAMRTSFSLFWSPWNPVSLMPCVLGAPVRSGFITPQDPTTHFTQFECLSLFSTAPFIDFPSLPLGCHLTWVFLWKCAGIGTLPQKKFTCQPI